MKLNAYILLLAHIVYYYIQTFKQLLYTHIQFVIHVVARFPFLLPLPFPINFPLFPFTYLETLLLA